MKEAFLTSVSGLALVLFLLLHLGGVAQPLVSVAQFEQYATVLHQQRWLPFAEASLAITTLLHLVLTLRRRVDAARARGPVDYRQLRSRRNDPAGALAGSTMAISGGLLLIFLVIHLLQLRWERPLEGQEFSSLLAVLRRPLNLALYSAAGLSLGLHLVHGAESGPRGLGWVDAGNGSGIRSGARLLAVVVGGGFTLLPGVLLLAAAR